ncbi:MAG: phosphonate C-P lyase system protein PhnL [Cyanophyceae cyanobacterium]
MSNQQSAISRKRLPKNYPANTLLLAEDIHKGFTLHNQGGIHLSVLAGVSLSIGAGDCIALTGGSGSGKSTFMRSLYGNYRVERGSIWVQHEHRWVDITQAEPHELIAIRRKTIGYVSQFLRVIPRVSTLNVVTEPLLELGIAPQTATEKAQHLLATLNLPKRLWQLSPTTFSGGEKQRVNIARALSVDTPVLLLDEPTASLDTRNRQVVMELLAERQASGCALIGIFHDDTVKDYLCTGELLFERTISS